MKNGLGLDRAKESVARLQTPLLLSRAEVESLLDLAVATPLLREACRAYSRTPADRRHRDRSELCDLGSARVFPPGFVSGIPAYTVKVNGKSLSETTAPNGVVLLHEKRTGRLLALMDCGYLTAARTALVATIAADLLANQNARKVAVIGTGVLSKLQLHSLQQIRNLQRVIVFDIVQDRAFEYAKVMSVELGLNINVSPSLQAAVRHADIVLVATRLREPLLHREMVKRGAHISMLRAGEPGKCAVHAELIKHALFICDDREMAISNGAFGAAGLGTGAIHAELGEVLAGEHPGRVRRSQITIFGSIGLAFQDLVLAWQVYQAALQKGVNRLFDFHHGS